MGVRHTFGLSAGLAEIDFVNLVVHDLREVHRRRLAAKVTFQRSGHGKGDGPRDTVENIGSPTQTGLQQPCHRSDVWQDLGEQF